MDLSEKEKKRLVLFLFDRAKEEPLFLHLFSLEENDWMFPTITLPRQTTQLQPFLARYFDQMFGLKRGFSSPHIIYDPSFRSLDCILIALDMTDYSLCLRPEMNGILLQWFTRAEIPSSLSEKFNGILEKVDAFLEEQQFLHRFF